MAVEIFFWVAGIGLVLLVFFKSRNTLEPQHTESPMMLEEVKNNFRRNQALHLECQDLLDRIIARGRGDEFFQAANMSITNYREVMTQEYNRSLKESYLADIISVSPSLSTLRILLQSLHQQHLGLETLKNILLALSED